MEFGIVVMLFVLLISAVFDFGVILNARLSVSSLSRVLARAAAANATQSELDALANQEAHIIGVTTSTFSGYCCSSGDAIVVTYTYVGPGNTCVSPPGPCTPAPGDSVEAYVDAKGAEVWTVFMRPIFGCSGSQPHCFVPITAQTTMRVEPNTP